MEKSGYKVTLMAFLRKSGNSLAELIERACRRYTDKVAFLSMGMRHALR